MVYLTFIKRAEIGAEGWFLPKNMQQLYSLAIFVEKKCGKPSSLICAEDEGCIASAKLVNLVFATRGIQVTSTLSDKAYAGQSEQFIRDLLSKAEVQMPQHLVVILAPKQFEKFTLGQNSFAIGYINSSENWRKMYLCAEKHPVMAGAVPAQEIDENRLRLFIDSLEQLPY